VADYNTRRSHQALDMDTPAARFTPGTAVNLTATTTAPGLGPDPTAGKGSAGECVPTASCVCPGSRCALAATTPGPAVYYFG
jgi:hypothetical protein